jgi:hypothetical protein
MCFNHPSDCRRAVLHHPRCAPGGSQPTPFGIWSRTPAIRGIIQVSYFRELLHPSADLPAEKAFFIKTEDVDWVEAEGKYVRLHAGRQAYLVRDGIGELELQLDPDKFLRIHRSTIVNVARIKEMYPWFHGDYEVALRLL